MCLDLGARTNKTAFNIVVTMALQSKLLTEQGISTSKFKLLNNKKKSEFQSNPIFGQFCSKRQSEYEGRQGQIAIIYK